jgi:fatty acid desaturase
LLSATDPLPDARLKEKFIMAETQARRSEAGARRDARRSLPKTLYRRDARRFVLKFAFALGAIAGCWTLIALSISWVATAAAVVVVGLMYGHLVELQHECIHGHAFAWRPLNRICGIICGLFMLSSYSHYQYEHLRHHATLGKSENREFFDYQFQHLRGWRGCVRTALHLGRYATVLRDVVRTVRGRPIPGITREHDLRRIRAEHRLFVAAILAAVGFTAATGGPLIVLAWLLPLILVAEPTHFLIEVPEHFGLDTQGEPEVGRNTRTIRASRFAQWFTNYNNLHAAHHFNAGVPMANVRELHELVRDRFEAVEPSYWSFYRKLIRGEVELAKPGASAITRA